MMTISLSAATSRSQPTIQGRRFAKKVASPVITGTAVLLTSAHISACARISTPVDAANARENYGVIRYAILDGGSGQIPAEALSTLKNPIKSGLKTGIKSLRGWRWEESAEGHRLLDRQGRMAAWKGDGCDSWPPVPLMELFETRARA